MSVFKRVTHSLYDLRQKYFENGLENQRFANEMLKNIHTSVVTIVLAELALIGVLGFGHSQKVFSASIATILIIALILFLISISIRQIITQNEATESFELAKKVSLYIGEYKVDKVDEVPADLTGNNRDIAKIIDFGTKLINASYVLIGISSVALIIMVWRLVCE